MTLHRAFGHAGSSIRVRNGRTSPVGVLAALVLVLILAASCGSPNSSRTPAGSQGASSPVPTAGPVAVGAPGQSPTSVAAPAAPRVDFQVTGDENNGWWWLRDDAGVQQASWGFHGVTAGSQVDLDLNVLATDTTTGAAGVDARFWLSYGGILAGSVANSPGGRPVLVVLKNSSPPGDPLGYTATGTYALASATIPAGATGVWVRIARAGPDGAVLPGHLAVQKASVRIRETGGPAESPVPPETQPGLDYQVNGDEISGWWWLRDRAGSQEATWGFLGTPVADQIRLDLNLLATDTFNGGRGIDARFWLTYRTIVAGGGGSPLSAQKLIVLKNTSPSSDPVGYTTAGTYTIARTELAPNAIGIWVRIGRTGPDGTVLSTHIAVRKSSLQISGLEGPAQTPSPSGGPTESAAPSASPSSGALYGSLTITTECQENGNAQMVVSGSAAPDRHLEFSPAESFTEVFTSEGYVLSPPDLTFRSLYGILAFPAGIWVRWTAAPAIKAHASNKGYCPGWTPQPAHTTEPSLTPSPAATQGPPTSMTPAIVALGDSYISGEAGRWAGNTNDWYLLADAGGSDAYFDNASRTAETIPGCHRSESAEVHIDRGGYGNVTTINLACSGATTQTRNPTGVAKPGIDNCPNDIHRADCPAGVVGQGTLLTAEAQTHNVKLVVLSIGGNDFEFADTVAQCGKDFAGSSYWYGTDYCQDDASVAARFTADNITTVRTKLVNAYEDVVLAMRAAHYPDSYWSLLIQNYPSPLPPGGLIRYPEFGFGRLNYGCPFWNPDADWANSMALPNISNAIIDAVAEFSGNYPAINVKTMDVSAAFNGHRLCENTVDLVGGTGSVLKWWDAGASDGSEWVAQIRGITSAGGLLPLPGTVYFKNESFHPNYWGQLALRNCLRQAYNNGNVRGGACEFMQAGLNAFHEPTMILAQP